MFHCACHVNNSYENSDVKGVQRTEKNMRMVMGLRKKGKYSLHPVFSSHTASSMKH